MSLPDKKDADELRLRAIAERQIDNAPLIGGAPAHPDEKLLHELQVHQVELEMQNEALRQKQIELVEARDRYVGLYEFAPVGYLTLTAVGTVEEINLTAARLLGTERKNLLHRSFTALVIAEDQSRWLEFFRNASKSGVAGSAELALQRGDDTVFHAQLDCVCSTGSLRGVLMVLSDITQRKGAEELLRMTRFSVEAASDALFWTTPDARIVDVNEAACRALGYTREELLQLSVSDVDVHYSAELWPQHFLELRLCGSITLESEHRTKAGRVFPVEVVANYLEYDGEILNCAIVRNITDRKQAEAELLATKNQLQATLDAIPDLLFDVDLEGRIHNYHSHRTDLLAAPPEVFLGKTFSEVLPPEAAEVCLATLAEAKSKGWSIGGQFVLPLPQGEHWFELSVAPMAETAGQDRRYVLLSRDVTERKRTETLLAEQERELKTVMQEAHDRLASFAADQDRAIEAERKRLARELHDELGQGLTALHLDIEWLSGKVARVTPEIEDRFGAMRQMIAITADAMRQICEDMRPGVLDDLGLEAALEDHAQKFFAKSGIPCSLSMDRSDYGLSDPVSTALFRIFQEALTNIQRHAGASAVTATLEDRGDAVIMKIADDGKGLSDNAQAGDRFGLRGMRERVRLINGTFAIDSAPRQGTRIEVRIPKTNGVSAS